MNEIELHEFTDKVMNDVFKVSEFVKFKSILLNKQDKTQLEHNFSFLHKAVTGKNADKEQLTFLGYDVLISEDLKRGEYRFVL